MKTSLRRYLEKIGLVRSANAATAWKFYRGLDSGTAERAHAEALQRGGKPPEDCGCKICQRSDPEPAPSDPPAAPPSSDLEQARRAERDRIREIRELAIDGTRQEWIDECIDRGLTVDQSALFILQQERALRTEPVSGPAIHPRDHERDCTERALATGLMIRVGVDPVNPNATEAARREQEQLADAGHRYRGWSMMRMAEECLRLSGQHVPHDRDEMLRAAVSTPSFSNVFTQSFNSRLQMGWNETVDTTQGWVREEDVPNYQTRELVGLGKMSNLAKLPRGGTADHATISDNKEEYKIARYARQVVLDEQDVIDENLGVIARMPFELGQAARRLRPDLVYAILLSNPSMRDGNNLFDNTNHSNNPDDKALAAADLQTHIEAMAKQTEDGVMLNIMPRYLLVPQDLKFDAKIILRSSDRRDDTSTADGTMNPLRDENIELRSDNRLGAAGFTNPTDGSTVTGSATNWFLSAAAGRTIAVGYLAGTGRMPQIRRFTLDRGQYGIGWDVKLDIGAKAEDWRGLTKSAGTS